MRAKSDSRSVSDTHTHTRACTYMQARTHIKIKSLIDKGIQTHRKMVNRKTVSKKCRGKAFELRMNVAALIFFPLSLSLKHIKSLSLYACVCLYVCVFFFS